MKVFIREPALGLTALVLVGLMIAFIIIPQVQVVLAPGLKGYEAFFREGPNWIRATQNSLWVMLYSTTTAVVLGFIYAYAMVYSRMPWKRFFRLIAILPMLSPPFVVAASYILLFGPRGLITFYVFGKSPNILGFYGLWGVQTIAFFPIAYQLIADVLARSDPRLEQAARNLGAGPWKVFLTVTLPLSRPGLVAAILLVAIYVVEDFGNPALIAGQYTVLPTLAYGLISGFGDFAGAAVVSTILLGLAMTMYVIRLKLEGRHGYVTVSGRGSSIPRPPVPRVVNWACFAICLILAVLIVLVYGVLILSALVEAYPFNFTPTLKHFAYVGAHFTSLRNSLIYALVAAAVCSLLAMLLAYIVQRKSWRGRGLVDFIAIVPAAVPGIFFGIGYATTFNQKWLDWLDRGALITISMIFWNIPVGYRAAVAGLQQIDRSIDEAATSMGASSLRSFRDVLLPILSGPLTTGFVTTFVRAITTLSVVIFLFTPSTTVATITIFQLVNDFNWGGATAFTVSVIGSAILVLLVVWTIAGRRVNLEEVAGG
ncbi:MAG: iron ABC transporter permease [Chloroflexi bacterium]|nr:iron ABC transporter permease [Chloroflexota bacterium]